MLVDLQQIETIIKVIKKIKKRKKKNRGTGRRSIAFVWQEAAILTAPKQRYDEYITYRPTIQSHGESSLLYLASLRIRSKSKVCPWSSIFWTNIYSLHA